jgi:hypothetical protein
MARRPRPGVKVTHKAVAHPVGKPTPEHAAQREAMAEGGDQSMTTMPIDVALLRGRLSREQHAAAKQYRFLWNAAGCRTPHATAVDLDPVRGGSIVLNSEAEQRIHDEFTGARAAVRNRCKGGCLEVMESMVIYEHWPSWCWASNKAPLMASQQKAMEIARSAFDALEGYFSTLYGRSNGKARHTIMDSGQYMQPKPEKQAIPD